MEVFRRSEIESVWSCSVAVVNCATESLFFVRNKLTTVARAETEGVGKSSANPWRFFISPKSYLITTSACVPVWTATPLRNRIRDCVKGDFARHLPPFALHLPHRHNPTVANWPRLCYRCYEVKRVAIYTVSLPLKPNGAWVTWVGSQSSLLVNSYYCPTSLGYHLNNPIIIIIIFILWLWPEGNIVRLSSSLACLESWLRAVMWESHMAF